MIGDNYSIVQVEGTQVGQVSLTEASEVSKLKVVRAVDIKKQVYQKLDYQKIVVFQLIEIQILHSHLTFGSWKVDKMTLAIYFCNEFCNAFFCSLSTVL